MSSLLKQIADYYLLRGLFCKEIGLWNGKTGMSLFFFLLSRHTGNHWYEEFAGELLDDVCSSLSLQCPVTFADGLCGIGWAIEFLKKEGFIDGDTDDILEEVDKQVMERDVRRITDTSMETGLAGIAAYVRSRLDSERSCPDYQPFDTEYLKDLDNSCQKAGIEWTTDKYTFDTIWNKLLPLLPVEKHTDWQRALKAINKAKDNIKVDKPISINKKQLLIFTRKNCASRYGIGTYIKQLASSIDLSMWDVHIIELYADTPKYTIKEKNGICYNYFPISNNNRVNTDEVYQKSIFYWIANHYTSEKLHCQFNFTADKVLAVLLKENLKAHITFTLHYMEWKFHLNGKDEKCLQRILSCPQSDKEKELANSFSQERNFIKQCCDKIIVISHHSHELLQNLYTIDHDRITYIPHGLHDTYRERNKQELDEIRKKYHLSIKDKIILYVGRLSDDKGLHLLIASFKLLQKYHDNVRLIIVGNGNYEYYLKIANPSWNKISFTGYLSKEQIEELYAISTVGVIPSFHEELGYVAIEMFMHKLPVICSDVSGLKEVSDNGRCAVMINNWCNSNNLILLKDAIENTIINTQYLEVLKEKGRSKFLREYTNIVYQKKIGIFYQ